MDIKNAFRNGEFDEEVYMDLTPSLEGGSVTKKVCKLKKSPYNLKQSPRSLTALQIQSKGMDIFKVRQIISFSSNITWKEGHSNLVCWYGLEER